MLFDNTLYLLRQDVRINYAGTDCLQKKFKKDTDTQSKDS